MSDLSLFTDRSVNKGQFRPVGDQNCWARNMNRYSAKMLFQFRADLGEGRSNVMRLCEERIVVIPAKDASSALRKAKAYGKNAEMKFEGTETSYPNYFEFVGITDLLELGIETEPEEV